MSVVFESSSAAFIMPPKNGITTGESTRRYTVYGVGDVDSLKSIKFPPKCSVNMSIDIVTELVTNYMIEKGFNLQLRMVENRIFISFYREIPPLSSLRGSARTSLVTDDGKVILATGWDEEFDGKACHIFSGFGGITEVGESLVDTGNREVGEELSGVSVGMTHISAVVSHAPNTKRYPLADESADAECFGVTEVKIVGDLVTKDDMARSKAVLFDYNDIISAEVLFVNSGRTILKLKDNTIIGVFGRLYQALAIYDVEKN